MNRKQSCTCWIRPKRGEKFILFIPWFSLLKDICSPPPPTTLTNYRIAGEWWRQDFWDLSNIHQKAVITQTALLPSSHASCTLQAQRSVNVSVAGCLSSSFLCTIFHTKAKSDTLSQRIQSREVTCRVCLFVLMDGKWPNDALEP